MPQTLGLLQADGTVLDLNNTNPLPLGALGAGNNIIGVVGGITADLAQTPTITASTYTSGFSLGGLMTFPNAVRLAGGTGVLMAVTISDKAKAANAVDLLLFQANPTNTTFTDHSALTVNATDLLTAKITQIAAGQYSTFATNSVATSANLGIPFKLASGTSLYAAMVARGTTTYASTSDLQVTLSIIKD